jgi:methylated-DNA-[protein]-cysteine S-methyltransferase
VELQRLELTTPIDRLSLVLKEGRLCGLGFGDRWAGLEGFLIRRFGTTEFRAVEGPEEAVRCLAAYFEGDIDALARIEVDPGGSPFQARVWSELRRIPAGETVSYEEVARRIGQPGAARAVASANAANPVAIVVPCHRVIHADGSISGYGGGVQRKRWLLRHEAAGRPFRLRP